MMDNQKTISLNLKTLAGRERSGRTCSLQLSSHSELNFNGYLHVQESVMECHMVESTA